LPKKTFEAAAAARAHLIVQLKDNQLTLHRKVEAVCNGTTPLSGVQTVDGKKRNRHETRTVAVFDAAPAVMGTQWEPWVFRYTMASRVRENLATAAGRSADARQSKDLTAHQSPAWLRESSAGETKIMNTRC
jgi:hypothetical protein